MLGARNIPLAFIGLFGLTCHLYAAEFSHSWVEARYTPCEGVGAHGSFRIHVSGQVTPSVGDARSIDSLSVYASSAAFTQGEVSTSASARIKVGGSVKQEITLTRPTTDAIEPSPKEDETRRLYLPSGKTLALPKDGELWVAASTVVKTAAGVCALGGSEARVISQ